MDGKSYSSLQKILQDISIDNFDFGIDDCGISYYLLLRFIYAQSIIDLPNYYKTCTLISYKTSNNQEQLDKMPFYIFNNFTIYLNEIVEEENKGQKGNNDADGVMGNANKMMQGHMSSAKSMMSGMKLPK